MNSVAVIGGGLAGSEAALYLADHGVAVTLYEMRPAQKSPAHETGNFAELVCSNSLKSDDAVTAAGLLKREASLLGSRLLEIARECAVDAGRALAVDRELFAAAVTQAIENHLNIDVVRSAVGIEIRDSFDAVIVAAGPLASSEVTESIAPYVGDSLAFYDAAAPIISAESIDRTIAFSANRYDSTGVGDYLNCPMNGDEYERFINALLGADKVIAKDFETKELFAACQPVEEIARKGFDALRYGTMKPVGIDDPRTGRYPHALVQLRKEDKNGLSYNLVGFQTNLTFGAQREVFSLIPGLENADFLRYGVMHRNTFLDAPKVLERDLRLKGTSNVWCAGQITGTEGYMEAMASGLVAAINIERHLRNDLPHVLPTTTVIGALMDYATSTETIKYQPMHVNFGIIEPLLKREKNKQARYRAYAKRSITDMRDYLNASGVDTPHAAAYLEEIENYER